jgi:transcriptional regulator with XRE-family HTH domain
MPKPSRAGFLIEVDWKRFASDIAEERGRQKLDLRGLGERTGIGFVRISRFTRGETRLGPEAFLALLMWMNRAPADYTREPKVGFAEWMQEPD